MEIPSDVNSLKQRSFYDSDIGYTAQEIHEQHQRLHHLVQQQLQQQQSSHRRSEDDCGINDEGETDTNNDSCLHDAQRRSVIGYNISNNAKNLYEDTYRHSSTLLGLNPHNDYERLKINGRNSEVDCSGNPSGRSHLSNNNFDNNCKNNNSRNNDSNLRTSNKLLDITNHQYYPHLITMDGLRNQLVRRKSGTGSTNNSIRPPTVERCDQLQVTLRGWLYRLEGGAIKQWKRRWFVLGDYCLFYYKDSHEEKCHGSVLLPSYQVSICKPNEDGITRKFSFKLEHQNMKTYFLAADSKESMEQWMTALNLASIMQLNYGSNNANMNSINRRDLSSGQPSMTGSLGYGPDGHNQSEGHDVTDSRLMMMTGSSINNGKGYPNRCLTGKTSGGGEEEEDSGFNSYVPRRPPMPNSINNSSTESSGYLPAGAKYPGSFNCTGLSPISYHSSSYLAGHSGGQMLVYPPTHQKRSHYANAPPKPRRQQLDESGVLNCSDLYPVSNEFGAIPPGSHYNNQYFGPGNGPAPDLIAHNNSSSSNAVNNSSVCNSSSNIDQNNSVASNSVADCTNKQNSTNTAVNSNNYHQAPPYNSEYPQPDGINMQFTLSSPMSPNANANQHYSIPPPSQFTVSNNQMTGYHPHHHHQIQQQIQSQQQQHHHQQQPQQQQQQQQSQQQTSTGQYTRARLPPRPHSADFLDREAQDEDEIAEIENCYQHANNVNDNANVNGASSIPNSNGNHQYYQQQTSSVHLNSSDVDQSNSNGKNSNQPIQPPKILPIRPKSSLERYDPYYYTNHVEYGTSNGSINQQTQQTQQLTSPPPRPWSDYLQQQAARQNTSQQQQLPTTSNNLTQSSSNIRPKGITFPPSNFDTSPRGQQDRDVSLLRLLEWKQKMLSGPLNKRNSSTTANINSMTPSSSIKGISGAVKSPSHHHLHHSHHLNNSFGSDMAFTDVPMRPPLPKEYRTKIGLPDSRSQGEGVQGLMGDIRSHEEPIFSRGRSKSIGSSFPVNDTYSSDDEGIKSGPTEGVLLEPQSKTNRVRRRHESCGNPLASTSNINSKDVCNSNFIATQPIEARDDRICTSPDYMNINQLYPMSVKMVASDPTYMGPRNSVNIATNSDVMENSTSSELPSMLTLPRSGGDGQESEESRDNFIKREDYYKAPSTLRQPDLTMSTHPQSSMVMNMMTTDTILPSTPSATNILRYNDVTLNSAVPIIVSGHQQMPPTIHQQQFNQYDINTGLPLVNPQAPLTTTATSYSAVAKHRGIINQADAITATQYTYPDQWNAYGLTQSENQPMVRCVSRGATAGAPTNAQLFYRPASCGPISNVPDSINSLSINNAVSSSSKMPPPPPPKPQPKNVMSSSAMFDQAMPPSTLLASTKPQNSATPFTIDANEPRDTRLSEGKTLDSNKQGNDDNNVVNSSSNNKACVEPVKPEEAVAPPPNFVKERIKLLESKACKESDASVSQQTSTSVKDVKQLTCNKNKSSNELHDDSELTNRPYSSLDKPNMQLNETNLRNSAVSNNYSPLSSVLADLRKTAESMGDKHLNSLESNNSSKEGDRGDADGSSGSNQPISSKLSNLSINPNVSRGASSIEPASVSFSAYEDKGEDADDEMSREFDSNQYSSDSARNCSVPLSAKQKVSTRDKRIAFSSSVTTLGLDDPKTKSTSQGSSDLPVSSCQNSCDPKVPCQPVPELVVDSSSSYSTSMDNPAYVSSSYLEYALNDDEKQSKKVSSCEQQKHESKTDEDSQIESNLDTGDTMEATKSAPYYYSDLLPSVNDDLELPINYRQREKLARNQRSNLGDRSVREESSYSFNQPSIGPSGKKRCITPEIITETDEKSFNHDQNGLRSSLRLNCSKSEKRRSRSLENLDDDHLYENLEFLKSNSEVKENDDKLPELPIKQKNILSTEKKTVTYSQNRKVKFDEPMDKRTKESTNESESESDRSLLEGEGSQSGSYLDKKLRKRRSPRNRRSQDDLKNVSDSETTSKPPPPPPLPLGYNQHGYPYYCVNDNLNKLQRKLSRSVGTGLQNEQDIYNSKIFSSAGELLGKTHEELVLLLIQLRRNQSHLASTCESLRLQMESEEKMMEIEPQRREEHKSRYKELRESLLEVERQYENQFPVIDMVDNMVKLNHSGPGVTSNRHQQQHNRDHRDLSPTDQDNDFDFKRSKAASTSFLDRFPESQGVSSSSTSAVTHSGLPIVPQRGEQLKFTNYLSPPKKKEDEELVESAEQEKLIQYLKQDKDILEKTLEGVRSSLTNLSLNGTSDGEESPSTSSNIDKMKQQQQILEGELGRVRGLIVQSAKRLEQRAVENAWIEQDVLMARSQLDQILSSASTSTTMTTTNSSASSNPDPVSLEAELANIDQAIDNLNAKRKEILENFKKQKNSDSTTTTTSTPTLSTAQKPQSTTVTMNQTTASNVKTNTSTSSGYGETDLDSMESRDMAPFNYLKGYQQLTPENEIASTSGSNHLYENLDSNLVNYAYSHGSSNKINGRSEELIDDDPGRQCQSDDSTNESSTTRSEKIKSDQMVYNDNYDYGESSDGQQYTFQQPLLASNKTVRLVKRESERRRVTNKLSTYSTSVINYNNSNNNNTQFYQHFQQENDLSDFPVYTVNHSDGSTTIIDSGDNDEHFSEVDYDMVTSKRPSSLNLIEPTIKSDERKEGR